jgi:hypothetical protein
MATATKKKKRKEEAYPWKTGTSSGHITNFKQSILETFDIYGRNFSLSNFVFLKKLILVVGIFVNLASLQSAKMSMTGRT